VFGVIYLDNRHRMIACEELFTGTIDGTEATRGSSRSGHSPSTRRRSSSFILWHATK